MARIAGVDLPMNKRVEVALTYIYGIGPSLSRNIVRSTSVSPTTRVKDLTEEETGRLRTEIETKYRVEGQLHTEVEMNIKRLKDIGSYRGLRHRKGLPFRGQRPKTKARPRKGPKETMAGKKKPTK